MSDNQSAKAGASPQSPFEEVTDVDTIKDLFNVALKQQKTILVWLKDKTLQFEIKLAVVNKERLFFDLPRQISNSDWDSHYNTQMEAGEHHLLGTVQIIKTIFFLKLLVDNRNDRSITLYKPTVVYKLQRRANMRVRLSYVKQQRLTLNDPLNTAVTPSFRMLDVSVGGVGIAIKLEEAGPYKSGTKLTGLIFNVLNIPILCNGIVKHTMEGKDESGAPIVKVGIEFVGLPTEGYKIINQFISTEMQNIFSSLT